VVFPLLLGARLSSPLNAKSSLGTFLRVIEAAPQVSADSGPLFSSGSQAYPTQIAGVWQQCRSPSLCENFLFFWFSKPDFDFFFLPPPVLRSPFQKNDSPPHLCSEQFCFYNALPLRRFLRGEWRPFPRWERFRRPSLSGSAKPSFSSSESNKKPSSPFVGMSADVPLSSALPSFGSLYFFSR